VPGGDGLVEWLQLKNALQDVVARYNTTEER
jgi:hypothetical protein